MPVLLPLGIRELWRWQVSSEPPLKNRSPPFHPTQLFGALSEQASARPVRLVSTLPPKKKGVLPKVLAILKMGRFHRRVPEIASRTHHGLTDDGSEIIIYFLCELDRSRLAVLGAVPWGIAGQNKWVSSL